LEFEKSKGDKKSTETVTRKAKEYVEAKEEWVEHNTRML
jgi:rRNA biogenesis protein RRP5